MITVGAGCLIAVWKGLLLSNWLLFFSTVSVIVERLTSDSGKGIAMAYTYIGGFTRDLLFLPMDICSFQRQTAGLLWHRT